MTNMSKYWVLVILIITTLTLNSYTKKGSTHQKSFQKVLWSVTDSSHNNFRIPSIIVTKKNTILAFAEGREAGDSGNIDILLKRSTDNGKSWSKQTTVWNDGENTCGNPCPVIDQNTGRIYLFMTWNLGSDHEDKIIQKQSKDSRKPYMTYSDDDGLTWSIPKNLTTTCKDPDWGWYATGPGVGIQLKSGKFKNRLIIPANNSYSVTNEKEAIRDGFGYGAHIIYSDDNGANWSRSAIIKPGCNESQIVELSNGDLLMNMRSYNNLDSRAIAYSEDGGMSWSDIKHDEQLVESICQASLISYGKYENKNLFLFSNPAVSESRDHMTIKSSFDECETWSFSKLINAGPSAYSCMTVLPNGNVGIFYETGIKSPYETLLFRSIPVEQLLEPNE